MRFVKSELIIQSRISGRMSQIDLQWPFSSCKWGKKWAAETGSTLNLGTCSGDSTNRWLFQRISRCASSSTEFPCLQPNPVKLGSEACGSVSLPHSASYLFLVRPSTSSPPSVRGDLILHAVTTPLADAARSTRAPFCASPWHTLRAAPPPRSESQRRRPRSWPERATADKSGRRQHHG